jgi:hypothetical protein
MEVDSLEVGKTMLAHSEAPRFAIQAIDVAQRVELGGA